MKINRRKALAAMLAGALVALPVEFAFGRGGGGRGGRGGRGGSRRKDKDKKKKGARDRSEDKDSGRDVDRR